MNAPEPQFERKMTEPPKAGSDASFRKLVETLQVGVVVHNPDTSIRFSNHFASEMLGMSLSEISGRRASDSVWRFIREDGSPLPLDEFPVSRVKATLKPIHKQIIGVYQPGRYQVVWGLCNAYPEFHTNQELAQIIVTFTDITEEQHLKEKLTELNALFQAAVEQSLVGIAIADARTKRLLYLNQTGRLMRGIKSDLASKDMNAPDFLSFWNIFHLDGTKLTQDENPLNRALTNGEKTSREFLIKQEGEEDRIVWVNAAPILRPDGSIMAGITVFLDTTDRYRLIKDQRLARETAEKATLAKSRFLDVAAHELRTPITVFSLLLQLTQEQLEKGKPVELTTLNRLRTQVNRISRLVVDLLDVSRLERGVLTLSKKSTDLNSCISECIDDFQLREPTRSISFDHPAEPCMLKIDPIRIYQVLSNLLDNASKYADPNSPIEVKLESKPKVFRVSVRDHGPGIPDQEQSVLFTPFSRGSTELTEKAGGLGLGLFICRRIIELHEGTIGVSSKKDQGSTFFFELPKDDRSL